MLSTSLRIWGVEVSPLPSPVNGVVFERDEIDGVWLPRFDQSAVIMLLFKAFDGIIIGTQDFLLEDAQALESMLVAHGMDSNPLIASSYRKAKDLGPVFPFTFHVDGGPEVRGSVRRFDINFSYSENISAGALHKIKRFLEQFGVGKIEEFRIKD